MKNQSLVAALLCATCLTSPSFAEVNESDEPSDVTIEAIDSDAEVLEEGLAGQQTPSEEASSAGSANAEEGDDDPSCEVVAAEWSNVSDINSSAAIFDFINDFGHCTFFVTIATQELHRLTVEAEETAARAQAAVSERDRLRELVRDLRHSMSMIETDLISSEEQREALVARLGDAQVAADTNSDAAMELERQLQDERNRTLELRDALHSARIDMADALEDMAALNDTIAERQRRIEVLEGELGPISNEAAELNDQLAILEEALSAARELEATLSAEILAAHEDRDQAAADAYNERARADRLQEALEVARTQVTDLEIAVSERTEEKESLERTVLELNGHMADLDDQISALTATVAEREAVIASLQETVDNLTENLAERDAMIVELEGALDARNARIADLVDYTDSLYAELQAAQNQIVALTAERDAALSEIERREAEASQLQVQNDTLQLEIDGLNEELSSVRAIVAQQEELIEGQRAQIAVLTSERDGLLEEVAQLNDLSEEQRNQHSAEIDELTAENRIVVEGLQAQTAELNARINDLESRIAILEEQVDASAVEISELTAEVSRLNEVIEGLEAELSNAHARNAELEELNARLTRRAEETEAEFVRLNSAHEALVETHDELSASHAVALDQMARMRDAVDALHIARGHLLAFLTDIFGNDDCITQNDGRFSFCSTVMFELGSDVLSQEGRDAVGAVASQIDEIDAIIAENTSIVSCPEGVDEAWCSDVDIDWIIRIDGHTDDLRIHPNNTRFEDNWDLSTARAQAVVRYMVEEFDVDPTRLAATGFGEFHPVADNATEEGRARNRRIDITLSHR